MKPTDFAFYLSKYLGGYIAGQQNFSPNTIVSYRDTFKLFLVFCKEQKNIKVEKLSIGQFSKHLVGDFLEWLKTERGCSDSTMQQRLTVIRNFFSFLQEEAPEHLALCQEIMGMKFKKKPVAPLMNYLTYDGIRGILAQPNQEKRQGRRDLVMLTLLYDSGARVQELADIRVRDLRLGIPEGVNLFGKGSKWRHVPLMRPTVDLLKAYLEEQKLTGADCADYPLFTNHSGYKLNRAGIAYTVRKYANEARMANPTHIPDIVTPHVFRHSKAMHLLQSGIDLIYIRDILGHADVKTTEIYARIDSDTKRQALESVYPASAPTTLRPSWIENDVVMKMLRDLE